MTEMNNRQKAIECATMIFCTALAMRTPGLSMEDMFHNDKVEEEEWKNECLQKRFAEGVSNRVENDQESSAHLDSKTVGYNGIEREPVGTREQFRLHSRRPVPMAFSSISASTWNQLQE
jgi:hypothetical protein